MYRGCYACEICSNCNYVRHKEYGLTICMNCSRFIDIYLTKNESSTCPMQNNCPIKWSKQGKRPICKACRWAKIFNHPNLNSATLLQQFQTRSGDFSLAPGIRTYHEASGLSDRGTCSKLDREGGERACGLNSQPSERCLGANQTTIKSSRGDLESDVDELECKICKSPELVFDFVGLLLCYNCYKLIRYTAEGKIVYECRANGRCRIEWAPNTTLCDSCRIEKIIKHPDFLIESIFDPLERELGDEEDE